MYEITITPNHRFWDEWDSPVPDGSGGVSFLLWRVARVVCNNPEPFRQDGGYDWALDRSNDWKAERRGDDLLIAWRYGTGGNAKFMEALQIVLQKVVE